MKKKSGTKKHDPKATKLVDELVKKDIERLRIRSKITAGPRACCM